MLTPDRDARWVTGDDHLDHAYAVTVHRTQGATVDTAHVHTVADDLDQACEDPSRDWTTERRARWIRDSDTPATESDRGLGIG